MKSVSISGSLRGNVGKKDAKRNRMQGKVPCVLYGGKEQLHFVADAKEFDKLLFTPNTFLVQLVVDGKEINATLQDIQYHPVNDSILHADFLELIPGKPVVISIPLIITGTAPGVLKGGKLQKKYRKLKVKGLAENLPDDITISINDLDIGQMIKINDIKVENIQLLDLASSVVASVVPTRAAAEGTTEVEAPKQ
ncbi:MAG: 50S ribosomal protein L25/general stress protein Ctc [Lentimicrobiaceae bacterium]|jgi:large subunit ribosomal protein L25|nr:50S ribosomal protein L25/general stress protein Ctc [Lentimicrobiaceae bacterium]